MREIHAPVEPMSDGELHEAAGGCSELSCPFHGEINDERLRRGIHPRQTR